MALNPHYNHGLLWPAIAISLLLHAVLLLQPGLGTKASHTSAGPSLMALLRPRAEPPSREAVAPTSHAAHAPALAREVSAAAAPITVPTAAAPQTATEDVAVAAGTLATPSNANDTAKSATAPGNGGLEFAEMQKIYVFDISAELGRVSKNRYPPRAYDQGWTGSVEIGVLVATGGNLQPPRLLKPSGYADIDNAALKFVNQALKRTPVPESLRDRTFEIRLPLSFNLKYQ